MHSAPSVEYPTGVLLSRAGSTPPAALAWLAMQLAWWLSLDGAPLPGRLVVLGPARAARLEACAGGRP